MIARLSVFDMQYKERAHFSMYRVLNNFRPVWPYKGLCTAGRYKQRRDGIRAPLEAIQLRVATVRQNRPMTQRGGRGAERRRGEA